jgi:hypothetical protein
MAPGNDAAGNLSLDDQAVHFLGPISLLGKQTFVPRTQGMCELRTQSVCELILFGPRFRSED